MKTRRNDEARLPKGYDAYQVLYKIDNELANKLVELTQIDTDNNVSETLSNFNRHIVNETVKYFNTREDNSKL